MFQLALPELGTAQLQLVNVVGKMYYIKTVLLVCNKGLRNIFE